MADIDHESKTPDVIDLTGLTLEELRGARRRIERDEQELSFVRRMLQGRIDILKAEVRRRAGQGTDVVPNLSTILSGAPSGQARSGGRHSFDGDGAIHVHPVAIAAEQADNVVARLDPRDMDARVLAESLATLGTHERAVSEARALVHHRLDRMGSELTRRYREGTAQVDDLLAAARRK